LKVIKAIIIISLKLLRIPLQTHLSWENLKFNTSPTKKANTLSWLHFYKTVRFAGCFVEHYAARQLAFVWTMKTWKLTSAHPSWISLFVSCLCVCLTIYVYNIMHHHHHHQLLLMIMMMMMHVDQDMMWTFLLEESTQPVLQVGSTICNLYAFSLVCFHAIPWCFPDPFFVEYKIQITKLHIENISTSKGLERCFHASFNDAEVTQRSGRIMLSNVRMLVVRAFIRRLTEHNMSYKALYDIKYFSTLSALVMLFMAYPTYICFLSDILCFLKNILFKRHIFLSDILCFLKNLFFKWHIFLSDILCFLKNVFFFKQHVYVFKKHIDVIEFYRTCIWLVPLNNIHVILM